MLRRPATTFVAVFAGLVVLDQWSKHLVRTYMAPPGTSWSLIGRLLRLTYVRNTGAAFGMLPGHRGVFMTVSLLVLSGVAVYWARVRPTRPLVVVATGTLAAGAMGNLIERATSGHVTDFIQVPFDFPVFNVADSAIVVGVGLLMWWILFGPAEHGAATGPSPEPETAGTDTDAPSGVPADRSPDSREG